MNVHEFSFLLRAARRRLWGQVSVRLAALGIAVGGLVGLMVALSGWLWPLEAPQWWASASALAGGIAGLAIGLVRRPSMMQTALAIDRAGHLKDRVHSALQFSTEIANDPYRELQVSDATTTLGRQKVSLLFPWRWPREATCAVASGVLTALVVLLVPQPRPAEAMVVGPPPAVHLEAALLAHEVEELEEAAEALQSDELKELARELRKALEEMLAESRSTDEAMLHLARMTAAVETAAAGFDALLLEQAMHELGEGLKGLEELRPVSELLKDGKFSQAAQALNQFGENVGSGQQAMPQSGGLAQERLGQLAQGASESGLKEMSESLSQMSDAIKDGSKSECKSGACKLGGTIGKYGNRVKASSLMRSQLASLSQCKSGMCKNGGYCSSCREGNGQCKGGQCKSNGMCSSCKSGGDCQGGNCKGIKSGLASLSFAKSNSPSESAGTAIAGNLFGKTTELDGNLTQEQITGQLGEGHSEVETEISPEGEQSATARYRQVYAKYSKISDAVMDEEAVPLGHRRMIKRYFELIHPDRVETEGLLQDEAIAPASGADAGLTGATDETTATPSGKDAH